MSNFAPRTDTVAGGHYSWLASSHGTDATKSCTLDADAFSDFDDGVVPAGAVLYWTGENGRVTPDDGGEEANTPAGHLMTARNVSKGDAAGAVLVHGQVRPSALPENSGWSSGLEIPGITYLPY